MKPLNQRRLEKAIHALKSGKYGENYSAYLVSSNKQYNALGVLCNVYRKTTGKGQWLTPYSTTGFNTPTDYCVYNCLPGSVAVHFGLSTNPCVKFDSLSKAEQKKMEPYKEANKWVRINTMSSHGLSHQRIAKCLEETYITKE